MTDYYSYHMASENASMRVAIMRVYELHYGYLGDDNDMWCTICNVPMPCETIRVLEGI